MAGRKQFKQYHDNPGGHPLNIIGLDGTLGFIYYVTALCHSSRELSRGLHARICRPWHIHHSFYIIIPLFHT